MKKLLIILLFIPLFSTAQRLDFVTKDSVTQVFTKGTKIGYLYQKGDSIYAKCKDSIFLLSSRLQMGCMHLTSAATTTCTNANEYYKITGSFANGSSNNFTVDGTSKITFTGIKGTKAILTGVSDLTADKVALLTYGLYLNGSLIATAETPVDINNPSKSKSIAITRLVANMKSGDYYEVYVKSNTSNTVVTSNTLMLTFSCDR